MATVRHRWQWRDKHNAICEKCGTHAQKRPSPYGRRWWTEWRLPDGTYVNNYNGECTPPCTLPPTAILESRDGQAQAG